MTDTALCEAVQHAARLSVTVYSDGSGVLTAPSVVVLATDTRGKDFSHISQAGGSQYAVVGRADAERLRVRVVFDPWSGAPKDAHVTTDGSDAVGFSQPQGCVSSAPIIPMGAAFWRLDNPWLWGASAGVLGVLGAAAYFMWRRR